MRTELHLNVISVSHARVFQGVLLSAGEPTPMTDGFSLKSIFACFRSKYLIGTHAQLGIALCVSLYINAFSELQIAEF